MSREYEITLRGEAGKTVRAAFADFRIEVLEDRTVVCGELEDQAALYGVLDRARSLGLEVLEVRPVESGPAVQGGVSE